MSNPFDFEAFICDVFLRLRRRDCLVFLDLLLVLLSRESLTSKGVLRVGFGDLLNRLNSLLLLRERLEVSAL